VEDRGSGRTVTRELRRAAKALHTARERLASATDEARRVAIAAYADGVSEAEVARVLGVDRARTLRRWLGKDGG